MKEKLLGFFTYIGRKLNAINICIDKNKIAERLTVVEKKLEALESYSYDDGK